MNSYLNLVFHNIVNKDSEISSKYAITVDFFAKLKYKVLNLIGKRGIFFKSVRFYFDDNYASFYKFIFPLIKSEPIDYVIAVPTDFINRKGYMTADNLLELSNNRIKIVPHGVSHAALCIYSGKELLKTESGGRYLNTPYGKEKALIEEEVAYQLNESRNQLELCGIANKIDEFVLPYGLYNRQILKINRRRANYKYISTCNEYLDNGRLLRPRFLITNDRSIMEIIEKIKSLKLGN